MAAFQARANAELVDGQFNASASFAIPEGQKLSARFISVYVMVPIGQTIQVNFNADTGGTGGFVPMALQGATFTLSPGGERSTGSPDLESHKVIGVIQASRPDASLIPTQSLP